VVFAHPGTDDRAGVIETDKPVLIETLVAQSAVEGFDVGVLVGLARLNQAQRDTVTVRPDQHGSACECLAVVGADDRGPAAAGAARYGDGAPSTAWPAL